MFYNIKAQDFSAANAAYSKCGSTTNNMRQKASTLTMEYNVKRQEYAQGLFCSQCMDSKSEIEKGGESFQSHLSRVKGYPVPATPQQMAKLDQEYQEDINHYHGDAKMNQAVCEQEFSRMKEEAMQVWYKEQEDMQRENIQNYMAQQQQMIDATHAATQKSLETINQLNLNAAASERLRDLQDKLTNTHQYQVSTNQEIDYASYDSQERKIAAADQADDIFSGNADQESATFKSLKANWNSWKEKIAILKETKEMSESQEYNRLERFFNLDKNENYRKEKSAWNVLFGDNQKISDKNENFDPNVPRIIPLRREIEPENLNIEQKSYWQQLKEDFNKFRSDNFGKEENEFGLVIDEDP